MAQKGEYRPALQIPPADEQVAEILSDRQRHFDELRLGREERERLLKMRRKEEARKRKEKEKAAARKANKVTVDIPLALRESLEDIASKEGVTISQVITFFLFDAVERYNRNEIGFWGYKHPSESPRYEWILVHPNDTERTEKIKSRKSGKSW